MIVPDHLTCLLRNCMWVKKQHLELDMEQWTGSKLGKEYYNAVYCHPDDLTSMQSISCEMLGLMKHKLESRCSSVQFSSVTQSCSALCNPIDCSTPGFPVHHQLLELAQIHIHWVGDAIQPSYPLSSLSPPAFNLSQNQGLSQWVRSSHQVAKVLEFQLQHQSFQWIVRTYFL